MAPLGRILAQVIVPIIATVARAIPAAYNQAVQRAKQGGVSAAAQSSTTPFARRLMPKEEALLVLNISDTDVTAERVEQVRPPYLAQQQDTQPMEGFPPDDIDIHRQLYIYIISILYLFLRTELTPFYEIKIAISTILCCQFHGERRIFLFTK
jgi:hypothetical protein